MCQGYLLQFIRAVFLNVDLDPDVVPDPVLMNGGVSSKLSKIYLEFAVIYFPSVPTIGFLFQKINKYNQQFPSIFLFFSACPSDTDPGGKIHIYTEKSSVQAKSLFILLWESNQWRSRLPAGVLGIYKNVQMTSKMASPSWSKSKLFYISSFVT